MGPVDDIAPPADGCRVGVNQSPTPCCAATDDADDAADRPRPLPIADDPTTKPVVDAAHYIAVHGFPIRHDVHHRTSPIADDLSRPRALPVSAP
ncbi:hypothetical protein PBRA_009552 [Plasmodiophora brassicae]|uniref:Uncharacterized protein n=1 Tax=Plasmodiophora brassicae TaxID=37360 RepID=A0A0G4J8U9_PLABS|nr:hypothetical protein PBRA_009552 [Plasmodiophora brassicae]